MNAATKTAIEIINKLNIHHFYHVLTTALKLTHGYEGVMNLPGVAAKKERFIHILWRVSGGKIRRDQINELDANLLAEALDDAVLNYEANDILRHYNESKNAA